MLVLLTFLVMRLVLCRQRYDLEPIQYWSLLATLLLSVFAPMLAMGPDYNAGVGIVVMVVAVGV
jgi:hypothetical protein